MRRSASRTSTKRSACTRAASLGVLLLALGSALPTQALAQSASKSGYAQTPTLEGPDGVLSELAQDDAETAGILSPQGTLKTFDPWYASKKRLNDAYGLQLSFSYQTLFQSANETLTGTDSAAAARGQIQGAWTLLNRGSKNEGKLTFRIRNRYALGSQIAPTSLAAQFGSVALSGTGFGDSGLELNELAWRQSLFDGRLKFIAGNMSAISWYNTTALSSSLRGFQNTALQSSLSKPGPGRGLGFGAGVEVTPNIVVVAGIHDANSSASTNPLDTIKQEEYFKSVEFRYLPADKKLWRWDTLKLQYWHQDAIDAKGLPESEGITFQAGHLFNEAWYPFAFGGWSDGKASIFKQDLVAGLGHTVETKIRPSNDVFGVAVGWGNPSLDHLQDQYTAEVFYRLQLLGSLAITPAIQIVHHPAANFKNDQVVLFSLRTRLQF